RAGAEVEGRLPGHRRRARERRAGGAAPPAARAARREPPQRAPPRPRPGLPRSPPGARGRAGRVAPAGGPRGHALLHADGPRPGGRAVCPARPAAGTERRGHGRRAGGAVLAGLPAAGGRRLRAMTRYLHTMYRITDPERSRAFYEALGFEFRRETPIVR